MLKPYLKKGRWEAGCDEAGRGCLAGPVYAAAVILPLDIEERIAKGESGLAALNDSKQLSEKRRYELRPIIEREALAWAVGVCDNHEIDKLNILWASVTGMQRAVLRLQPAPAFLLVDGNKFRPFGPYGFKDYQTVVHGDATYASIAAASVLAKTHRDAFMRELATQFPEYGWDRNMGYPTAEHIAAIRRYGYTPWHRKSFHVKELEPSLF